MSPPVAVPGPKKKSSQALVSPQGQGQPVSAASQCSQSVQDGPLVAGGIGIGLVGVERGGPRREADGWGPTSVSSRACICQLHGAQLRETQRERQSL